MRRSATIRAKSASRAGCRGCCGDIERGDVGIDRDLIEAWLHGRSLARGLPRPARDASGALRVDTGTPAERCRYLFAEVGEAVRSLGAAIDDPRVTFRVCAPLRNVVPLLGSRWLLNDDASVMIGGGVASPVDALPGGYDIVRTVDGVVAHVRIIASDGTLAASGFAAETDRVFVYDRIRTEPAHRRRSLGRALMAALRSSRRDDGTTEILVATIEGRALYASLGWTVVSPYVTATLRDEPSPACSC